MKKSLKKYIIGVLVVVIIGGIAVFVQDHSPKKITFDQNDITLIGPLVDENGVKLGDLYVTYRDKDIFTSLYVVKDIDGKNAVIYKADKNGFFNTVGKDSDVPVGNFYGYQFALVTNNHFVLHMLSNEGRNVSDDVTVTWNKRKGLFEIYTIPF